MPVLLPTPDEFAAMPLHARRRLVRAAMRLMEQWGQPMQPAAIAQPSTDRRYRWTEQDVQAVRREADRIYLHLDEDPDWRQHQAALEAM